MTSTWFAISLACIAFLTGIMGFAEDLVKEYPKLKSLNEVWFKVFMLFTAVVVTFIVTINYNDYTEGQSNIKSANQHKADSTTLAQHDSLADKRVDGINNNTIKLLARYGYKVDSLHNILIKDTGKKVTNIMYGAEPVMTIPAPMLTVVHNTDSSRTCSILVKAENVAIKKANFKIGIAVIINGQYVRVSPLIPKYDGYISAHEITTIPVTIKKVEGVSSYFFYLTGTFENNEGISQQFDEVVSYNKLTNSIGILAAGYKESVIQLFK